MVVKTVSGIMLLNFSVLRQEIRSDISGVIKQPEYFNRKLMFCLGKVKKEQYYNLQLNRVI